MIVTLVVAILNALGAVLPSLPGLIEQIRGHADLTDGGKAALAALDDHIAAHERKADAVPDLPVPEPKPTAPG